MKGGGATPVTHPPLDPPMARMMTKTMLLYYSLTGYTEDCKVSEIGGLGEEYRPGDGRGHGPRQGGKSRSNVGTGLMILND